MFVQNVQDLHKIGQKEVESMRIVRVTLQKRRRKWRFFGRKGAEGAASWAGMG